MWRALVAPVLIAGVLVVPAGLVTSASAASAAPLAYGPTATCTITLSVSVTEPGVTIRATGNCGKAGFTLTFTIQSTPQVLATTTAGANGAYSVPLTIPSNISLGQHTVTVSDGVGDSASAALTIVAPGAAVSGVGSPAAAASPAASGTTSSSPSPSGLAFTGTDEVAVIAVGAAAIGLGGALVLSSRKRRRKNFSS